LGAGVKSFRLTCRTEDRLLMSATHGISLIFTRLA